MTKQSSGDITQWVESLRDGDEESAARLWESYFGRLVLLARRRLVNRRYQADPEDVALSAFHVACHGLVNGEFGSFQHRDEFWALLATLVLRKLQEHERRLGRMRRGGEQVLVDVEIDEVVIDPRDPAALVFGEVVMAELLDSLPDESLRLVASWKLEGYTVPEIAERLACSGATVKRKLALVREYWAAHLQ